MSTQTQRSAAEVRFGLLYFASVRTRLGQVNPAAQTVQPWLVSPRTKFNLCKTLPTIPPLCLIRRRTKNKFIVNQVRAIVKAFVFKILVCSFKMGATHNT